MSYHDSHKNAGKTRPHRHYIPNMRFTRSPAGGGNRLTDVSTGQGGRVHLMWAKRPHLRIIVNHQHPNYNYNQIRDVACIRGIQGLYETSPSVKISQFYSLSQVNYLIISMKSWGWGVISRVKIDS